VTAAGEFLFNTTQLHHGAGWDTSSIARSVPIPWICPKIAKSTQPADFAAVWHETTSAESAETCAELIELGAPSVYLWTNLSAEI